MKYPEPRDIVIRVGVGDVYSMVVAEGASWNPDIARDLVNRLDEVWRNTIETAVEAGLIDTSPQVLPVEDCEDDDFDDDDFDDDDEEVDEVSNILFSDEEVDDDGSWR
jgi:hypothetical protein